MSNVPRISKCLDWVSITCTPLRGCGCAKEAYTDVFSPQDGVWAWSAILGALAMWV